MLSKLPFVLAITSALLITGCNDDDPVNDKGIEDVIEFKIADYDKVPAGDDLTGVWVAVGTGTFERDKSGDRKYGEQSAKIYFVIKGSEGAYKYANCFDEGRLEGGFDRGEYDLIRVVDGITFFDSDDDGTDSDGDGTDDLSSEDDGISNVITVIDNSELSVVFTYNVGGSIEKNTFQMIKVGTGTSIGSASYEDANGADPEDVACFAQWSGSYSSSDGYFTVERYDASLNDDSNPFTASQYMSDDEDITEYTEISYEDSTSLNTKNGGYIDLTFFFDKLAFSLSSDGVTVTNGGTIVISHDNLK